MAFEKNHREITLTDCKEKLTVRGLQSLDYTYVGRMPDTLLPTFIKLSGKKDVNMQDIDPESADFLIEAIFRGVVKQNGKLKLVHKKPTDCEEGEISFFDLTTNDQAELTDAIFSGGEGLPLKFLEAVGTGIRTKQESQDAGQEIGQK